MTILNSKVDVLRGWTPGGDAGIDQSLPPVSGSTFAPGSAVALQSTGEVDLPAAPSATRQPIYFVVEGNTAHEYDTDFVGKMLCLRGKLTVKTDVYLSAGLAVGGPITVNASGQFIAAGANYRYGFLLADDTAVDGTITIELDL